MDARRKFLGVDIGASSGRVIGGLLGDEDLQLQEVHRFDNGGVEMGGTIYWNLPGLWANIRDGLRIARTKLGEGIISVGADTWGVDFGLLDANGQLLGNPTCYRDKRTDGMIEKACELLGPDGRDQIFAETGLQFMELNTLFQFVAMRLANSPQLDVAETMLLVPDLVHWLMCGEKANELTEVSTTQCYNPQTGQWATGMLEKLGIPTEMLQRIVPPGTDLGLLRPGLVEETGLSGVHVVLPGTHDTASAVMSVPAESKPGAKPDWAYISLGTWALMGIEAPEPVVTDQVKDLTFTNEVGVGETIRLLKNIAGLWILQECRRIWARDGADMDWPELIRLAEQASAFGSLIDPDAKEFVSPDNMPAQIKKYCGRTGQTVPQSKGEIVRCILESLALKFRQVLGMCLELNGSPINTLHIVGGGSQNRLLCQMAADACNCLVVAGPVEATAIGNVMMQAVAAGAVANIAEAREVIRRSFEVANFTPQETAPWDDAYARFMQLLG